MISGPGSIVSVWGKEGSQISVHMTPKQVTVPFMFITEEKYHGSVANYANIWFLIVSVVYCNCPIITKLWVDSCSQEKDICVWTVLWSLAQDTALALSRAEIKTKTVIAKWRKVWQLMSHVAMNLRPSFFIFQLPHSISLSVTFCHLRNYLIFVFM